MHEQPQPQDRPQRFGWLQSRKTTWVLLGFLAVGAFFLLTEHTAHLLGIITLAQGWGHATQQLADDRGFVSAIMAGFGTQVGLYTYLRGMHLHTTASGVAASTGTSTIAMLACCAHHLTEVFAIFGLSGAAIFLTVYKTPLLWLGIVMNLFGIIYLLWKIRQRQRYAVHMHG